MYDDRRTEYVQDLKWVELDALVILQIMKHCRQNAPNTVNGQLLGLDVEDDKKEKDGPSKATLQVTHSFGFPQKDRDDNVENDSDAYTYEMMKKLRVVNVDSNNVGWYQTTHLGQFFSETVINHQFECQYAISRSILLVYDPLQSAVGKAAFKAFQLSAEYMSKHEQSREVNNTAALNDFNSGRMFVEIPIRIRSPLIVEAFLVDWCISDPLSTTTQLDTLDVENQGFVEKNVQLLISSLQDLAEEQNKLAQHERNAGKGRDGPDKGRGRDRFGRFAPPKQLDTMVLSQQIQNYCKQINEHAGDSFGKLFLLSNKPVGAAKPK